MKTKLKLLFFLLVISQFNYAQIGFEDQVIIDNTFSHSDATSTFAADLDGDGDLDILSSDLFSDKLYWYENIDGQGNFDIPKTVASELDQAYRIYAADLDNDGDQDVISVSANTNRIAWYKNLDGQGTFGPEQGISTISSFPGILDIADIDGDGDLDIVSANTGLEQVVWYENTDGLGTFGDVQVINGDLEDVNSVHIGDIDGDGDMDVLATSAGDNKIVWYENTNGQGNFSAQQIIADNAGDEPRFIATADLDGDGDLDAFSGYYDDDILVWFENLNGQGNFSAQQIISEETNGIRSATAADIDNDGDLDIISTAEAGWDVAWFENLDGQGSFGAQQFIDDNARSVNLVFAVDIDNDSNLDILTSARWKPGITWYKNIDGQGTFGASQPVTTDVSEAYAVASTDIDGDGDLDVVSASLSGNTADDEGEIAWYENLDGEGTFGVQQLIANPEVIRHISMADLDGDGDPDLIFDAFSEPNLGWIENLGQGNFSTTQDTIVMNIMGDQKSIQHSDLDSDGDIDILAVIFMNNVFEFVWYENLDGLGNFGTEQIIEMNSAVANERYPSDLDGDGDIDIVFTGGIGTTAGLIGWIENLDGQGTFGTEQIISGDDLRGGDYIQTTDIDGDGDLDIVLGTYANPLFRIMWFENLDGQGTFSTEQIITVEADWISGIVAADIDDDGDIDIANASDAPLDDDEIAWYENTDGQGVFGPKQVISTNVANVKSIQAGDLDQDGDMDLLSASNRFGSIIFHKNQSLRTNEIKGTIRVDGDANGCDAADLPIANIMVKIEDGTDELGTFSLTNGFYQFFPEEGTFTTSIMAPEYYSVNPASNTSIFTDIGNRDTVDFCLEPTQSINDLNISVFPLSESRPGFDATYQIVYTNMGTGLATGSVVLNFDNTKLNFLDASEVISMQTDTSLAFDYVDLRPFETRTINLNYNVLAPPVVGIGDLLNFKAIINPIVGDNTIEDNEFVFEETVIGSFDPNDIRVLEGDSVLIENSGKYLHYIIRFQNTGTASAINVIVENVLDSNLDWNTFQVETTSHDNRVEIKNGNEIAFVFNEIYLPDSTTNEPESNGFITYKIKPNSDVVIGDIIANKADIFFDFNLPIETNTVTTEFVERDTSTAINEYELLDFSIYPIPTTNTLNVRANTKIVQIEIFNNLGELILVNSDRSQIDISTLSPGIYFCKVVDEFNDQGIKKIVKK